MCCIFLFQTSGSVLHCVLLARCDSDTPFLLFGLVNNNLVPLTLYSIRVCVVCLMLLCTTIVVVTAGGVGAVDDWLVPTEVGE